MKRSSVCVVLLWSLLGLSGQAAERLDFVQTRSALLTEGILETPFGMQSSPLLHETTTGYCAAWRDTRQGGAVMAARLDEAGTLLDPLGIPVSPVPGGTWAPWQVDIVSRDGRCMVTYREGTRVMGRMISTDGNARPFSRELFDAEIGYWQVTEADGDRALISVHHPWGLQLALVDADGQVLWSHPIETGFYQLRAVIRGTTALVLVQPSNRTGTLDLWRVDSDGATRSDTTVLSSRVYHWGVVDEGQSLLVIDLDPANDGGPVRLDRISASGETIASWFPKDLPKAGHLEDAWNPGDGSVRALLSLGGELALIEVRGQTITTLSILDEVSQAAMTHGLQPMSLWREENETRLRYGFGLPAQGPGEPISEAVRIELLADATATPGRIAALWVEASPTTGTQRLMQGFIEPENLTLEETEEISAGQVVADPIGDEVIARASIAAGDHHLQIAWIEGSELKTGRRGFDGTWLGEAQTISSVAAQLHPEGLISVEEGFFLTWTDAENPHTTKLRAAHIGRDGVVAISDPPFHSETRLLEWPAALATEDNLLVAVRVLVPQPPCSFLCPEARYTVEALSLNRDGEWSTLSFPELMVSDIPTLAVNDDLFLFIGNSRLHTFRLSGDAFMEEGVSSGSPVTDAHAIGWRDGFLIAGRRGLTGASSQTVLTLLQLRGDPAREAQVALPDASHVQSFRFIPSLVEIDSRIYVIGSEVSLVSEEGMVRRLRVHEILPISERRRTVRRR